LNHYAYEPEGSYAYKTGKSKTRHKRFGGKKRPTGQTAPEKEAVLRKIDFFFQPLISIKLLILC